MTKRTGILGAFFFLCNFGSYGQIDGVRFTHLSVNEGLSQGTILTIAQDDLGFLWLGTADGLNRYDGYEFVTFRHDPSDSGSISDNEIMAIHDAGPNLWIGSARGIDLLNKNSAKCTHFRYTGEKGNGLSDNYITVIYQDSDQISWIGTANGLNKYDTSRQSFEAYFPGGSEAKNLKKNFIRCIFETNNGDFWVGTDQGAYLFDRRTEEFSPLSLGIPRLSFLKSSQVTSIYEDKTDNLWLGTNLGLYQIASNSKTLLKSHRNLPGKTGSISSDLIKVVFESADGTLWIGTDSGLNRLDENTGQFITYKSDPLNLFGLSNNTIHSIFEDASGILWVGTGSGLNKYDKWAFQFNPVQARPSQRLDLADNKIWAIYEDASDATLWVGTEMGLEKCDLVTNEMIWYTRDPLDPNSLSNNVVKSILPDNHGIYWIGTEGGLNRFDYKQMKFEAYSHTDSDSLAISNDLIRVMVFDGADGIWIGTANGLTRFDKIEKEFKDHRFDQLGKNTFGLNSIRTLFLGEDGYLWIGTEGGLIRFNPDTEQTLVFDYEIGDSTSLSHNFVRAIYQDSQGNLWIGTSGGLNRFDRNNQKFQHYRIKDGMPNDVVYGIEEDSSGNLWISTNRGIARFNPVKETFKNYDSQDGLQSNEFNTNACFKNEKGVLFFGGTNGLNIFHPDNIQDNQFIPPVVFSGFEILNKNVAIGENYPLKKSINTADEIYLDYSDYMFTFRYAGLNFTNSEKNQYQYFLEGFDKEWNKVGTRRFATYTNIPGGNYVFKVRASNNSGIWNETGTSIKVHISAPFWQKAWFQILAIISLLLLAYGFYRYRIRIISSKKEELERIVAKRTDKIFQQKIKLEQTNQELNTTLNKLKETQTQLIQSEKMATLGHLTAGVAHEINNPVNFIYSGINGLDKNLKVYMEISQRYEKIQSSEEFDTVRSQINDLKSKIDYKEVIQDIQRMMSSIKEGAERTANIVKGLQIFSRSDDTALSKADIHEGIESTLLILNNRIGKHIKIEKRYDGTIPKIECYPGQLNQVFMNILSNAVEAIGENQGTIIIETKNHRAQVVITIEDTGEGIPPEVQSRIFEPFFTTKDVGKGTGLGLSISYGIIKKHDGSLTFTSKVDQGSKFTISLPTC